MYRETDFHREGDVFAVEGDRGKEQGGRFSWVRYFVTVLLDEVRIVWRTLRTRVLGKADRDRWSDLANFNPDWNIRTQAIAALIPENSRVIEFGAGRRRLESLLHESCTYIPSDLVSRGPDTLVADLNGRPLPDLSTLHPDVAVFGGVLEYVAQLRDIPLWLSPHVDLCITSYQAAKQRRARSHRIRDLLMRTRTGWVNHYTEDDFRCLFEKAGFSLAKTEVWHEPTGDGTIYVFRRQPSSRQHAA